MKILSELILVAIYRAAKKLFYFSCSFAVWQEVRNGSTNCTACMETLPCQSHYLTFGGYPDSPETPELHSKIALTAALSVPVDGPDQPLPSPIMPHPTVTPPVTPTLTLASAVSHSYTILYKL